MLKVLVVDDEAPIRQWLAYCVDRFDGFAVCGAAAGGQQALEIYRRERPDILLTDIEMPGMDGLEMMRRMKELHPAYMIVLTSHEDFDYARQALKQGTAEYILKTELSEQYLLEVLRKAAAVCRRESAGDDDARRAERFLLRLAAGEHGAEPVTEGLLRRQAVPLREGLFFAADLWSRDGADLPGARQFLARRPGLYNLLVAPLGYEHLLLAGNLQSERDYLELVDAWREEVALHRYVAGLSDPSYRLRQLPGALAAAQARCRLHFYFPDRRLLWQEPAGGPLPRQAQSFRTALSRALLRQNYAEALAVQERALRCLREERPTDLDAVKQLAADLTGALLRLTLNLAEEADRRIEETERQIRQSQEIGQLEAAVEAVFAPLRARSAAEPSYSAPVRQALDYLEAHYAEKVSLSGVAAMLSFSPEHFSRMFARETGMNFVTCLNNLRMKRAVELLEKTDKKVYEIAEEVGYSSVSYFSTAFKKSFGETPNHYQQAARHDPG